MSNISIVYATVHHNNTKKVVDYLKANLDDVELFKSTNIEEPNLKETKYLILASGIYFVNLHISILNYIEKTNLENVNVIFHGDPHSGNLCVDSFGNIYFLDMGLLFSLGKEEIEFCKEFFFAAYTSDFEKIFSIITRYGTLSEKQKKRLKDEVKTYCDNLRGREVTNYFMDMVMIFTKYELDPPEFLFDMAKSFVCLNGVGKFTQNYVSCDALLKEIILEYVIKSQIKVMAKASLDSIKIFPKALLNLKNYGLSGLVAQIENDKDLRSDIINLIDISETNINILKKTIKDYLGKN